MSPQKPERLRALWGPPDPLTFPTAVEFVLVGRLRVLQEQADGVGELRSGTSEKPQKQPPPHEPGAGSHVGKLRHRGGQSAPGTPSQHLLPGATPQYPSYPQKQHPPIPKCSKTSGVPPQVIPDYPQNTQETSNSFPKIPGGPRRPPEGPEGLPQLLPRLGSQPSISQKTRGTPIMYPKTIGDPQTHPPSPQKTGEIAENAPQPCHKPKETSRSPPQDQWDPRRPVAAP